MAMHAAARCRPLATFGRAPGGTRSPARAAHRIPERWYGATARAAVDELAKTAGAGRDSPIESAYAEGRCDRRPRSPRACASGPPRRARSCRGAEARRPARLPRRWVDIDRRRQRVDAGDRLADGVARMRRAPRTSATARRTSLRRRGRRPARRPRGPSARARAVAARCVAGRYAREHACRSPCRPSTSPCRRACCTWMRSGVDSWM